MSSLPKFTVVLPALLAACVLLVSAAWADEPVNQAQEEDVQLVTSWDIQDPKVGDDLVLTIELKNQGQAPASNLEVAMIFPSQLHPFQTGGTDENATVSPDRHRLQFPTILDLAAGESRVLKVKLRAKATGLSPCRVEFSDQALGPITLLRDELVRVR